MITPARLVSRLSFAASIIAAASCGSGNDDRTADLGSTEQAATIPITCTGSGVTNANNLLAAINQANATPEPDTITLGFCDFNFITPDNYWYGPTALPPITTDITIEGNGAFIQRDLFAPEFRIFYVAGATVPPGNTIGAGKLTLRNLTLRWGIARGGSGGGGSQGGGGGLGAGGAAFVHGELVLERVLLRGAKAIGGNGGAFTSASESAGGGGMGGSGSSLGGGGGFRSATSADGGSGVLVNVGGGVSGAGGSLGGGGTGSENGLAGAAGTAGGGTRGLGGGGTSDGGYGGGGPSTRGGGGAGFGGAGGNGEVIGPDRAGGGGGFGGGGGAGDAGGAGGGGGVGGGGGGVGDSGASGGQTGGSGGFGGGGGGNGGIGGFGGGGGGGAAGNAGFGGGGGEIGATGDGGGGAGLGGGVFVHLGTVTVINSVINDNYAEGGAAGGAGAADGAGLGAGIFNLNGTVTMIHATVAGNFTSSTGTGPGNGSYTVSYGAGSPSATSSFTNSIFADGTTPPAVVIPVGNVAINEVAGTATLTAGADNIFEEAAFTAGSPAISGSPTLGDPLLGPLTNNGGPFLSIMPDGGSIAIDHAGVNVAACAAAPINNADMRLYPRPAGARCDAGAIEAGALGPPALLVGSAPPQNTAPGATMATFSFQARDSSGAFNPNFTGAVTIAFAPGGNPGGSTLTGTLTRSAVTGEAQFDDISINNPGLGYQLIATSPGMQSWTTNTFNIGAVGPSLAFTQQPTNTVAGTEVTDVIVTRFNGAAVDTTFTGDVTLAIQFGPTGSFVSGTLTRPAVAGVATFDNLVLGSAGIYAFRASDGTNFTPNSSSIQVTAAAATHLAYGQQPTSANAGATITPAVTVQALDAFNNVDTTFNGDVDLAVQDNPSGGTLSGGGTVAAVNGVATYGGLSINNAGNAYSLNATSTGFTDVESAAFNITAVAVADHLAFNVQPSETVAGQLISPAVVVRALTAGNAVDTGFTGAVTIALGNNPGGDGALSGTLTVNAVAGVATFNDLNIDDADTGYTLTATASGLTGATSSAFDITPGAATQLVITVEPSAAVAGAANAGVTVEARDANGNVDTSFTGQITATKNSGPGAGALTGTTSVSAVGGVASFSNLRLDRVGSYTLAFNASGVTGDTSASFAISPAAAATLAFTVEPTAAVSGVSISPAVVVTALDSFSNVATGFTGAVTITKSTGPGSGVLSGDTSNNASSGVATFSDLSLDLVGTYTLAAAASGLTGDTSASFAITAGSATHLGFSVHPSTTTAGDPISPAIVVEARDASNNVATGFTGNVSLAIGTNPGSGSLSGTLTVAAVAGVATFSTAEIDRAGTGYTLTAAASGLTGATSNAFNITPGAATQLVITVEPSNVTAGAAIAPSVVVQARDALGNLDTSYTAQVTATKNTGPAPGSLTGTTAVSAVGGVATFSNLRVDRTGSYTLAFNASGVTGDTSASFVVSPGSATHLVFSAQPTNTAAGATISTVTISALDASDNVATGFTGNIALAIGTNPPGNGVLTNGGTLAATAGVATYSTLSINKTGTGYTLAATSSGLTGATSSTFNITPGAATHLAFGQQPTNQTAAIAIVPAPTVRVLDANDNLVTGFVGNVTMTKASGPASGSLTGDTVETVVNGVATFDNISIDKNGSYTLQAASGALTVAVSNQFNITPASASKLVWSIQPPSSQTAGVGFTVVVHALDDHDNLDFNFGGSVGLNIQTNPGGGTLSGTTPVTALAGVATFTGMSINKSGNGYVLRASSTGLVPANSDTFNIVSAAATHLVFSTQPSNTVAGVSINPAVVVHARDAFDNIATSFTGNVTMAIGTNPGTSTLSGTNPRAAVAGVATFSNLSLNKVGAGYTLTASASVTGATSSTFNITPASANHLVFHVQPAASTVAGVAISPAVVIRALDAFDNLDTNFAGNIGLAIGNNAGGGTLTGGTAIGASAGVATFAGLSINKTGAGYTLVTTSSLTNATSSGFAITPAPATHLVYAVQPSNVVAGVAIAPAVMVRALDAFDNIDTNYTLNVGIAFQTSPPSATLFGTLTQPAVAGTATFGDLSIQLAGSGYSLRASSGSLTGVTSNTFTVNPAAATHLVYAVNPSNVVAGFAIAPAIVLHARDQFENLATGYTSTVTLTISANPGGSTLGGFTALNAQAGVATFSSISLNKVGTNYTLLASGPTVTSVTSLNFNVTPAPASKLVFIVQPTNALAGAVIAPPIEVRARDQFDNLATGFNGSVTISISNNPGGSNLFGTATRTASAGVVQFDDLSLNRVGDDYTLGVIATNLTPATSAPFDILSGSANRLFFTVQPTTTVSGAAISPAVQVTVRDQFGNVANGFTGDVSVAIFANPGNATLSGTTTVAAVAGIATFTSLALDKVGSGYTLITTGSSLQSAISTTFNITPAAAATLHFTVQPGDVVAGVAHTPSLQVTARDPAGNQATGFTGMVTLAIGNNPGGSTLGGTLTRTAVSGVATFTGITLDKVGIDYDLTAASTGLPTATSAQFDVTPAAAHHLGFTVEPTSTAAGDPIAPAVRVTAFDQFDNVATQYTGAVSVAIGLNPGGSVLAGTTVVASVAGVATFSTLALDRASPGYTLTASAAGLTGATSVMFEITPSNASRLVFTVQPTDTVAGEPIAPALRVEARDTSGNLDGTFNGTVTMTIGANPGSSTILGTAVATASGGVAIFNDVALDKVGVDYTLVASAGGLVSATTQAFDITPAAASQLVFATQPLDATAGAFLSPPVRIEARDAFDNVDTSFTGTITIALGANPGSSTLSGDLVVDSVAGVTSFVDLSLNRVGTGYTLSASASGMTAVTSAPFAISPAAASQLAFFVQPSNVPAGQFMAPAVQVEARDPFGNRASAFNGAITLALGANPGPSTLTGTLSGPATAGLRTYSDLLLDRTANGYTLVASASGLASATSSTFDVMPGAATTLVFVVQPSDTVAGASITPAVRLEVHDAQGNVVPSFTGQVTVAIGNNAGNATLMGTAMRAATAGVTLFDDLALDHQGSGYTLIATANGVTSAISTAFNITPGAAARLAVSQQPTLSIAGLAITPAVQIAAEDNFGNRVPTFTGNITIALQTNPSGGTLSGTTTVAASAGVASFTTLAIDRAAVGYTLRATSSGLTMVDTVAFDVISGSAAALAFGVQPADVVAGVAFAPSVTVTVRDSQNNVDPTFNGAIMLSISNNPGSATLAGTISVLVVSGTATFTNVSLDKVGADYTLAATAAGVPAVTSSAFDVTAAAAATYTQSGLNANVPAAVAQAVTFTAHDQFGNVATGYDGTANLTSTDTDLEAPTTVTFTDGVSAVTNLEFHTSGVQMVTVTDQTTSSVTATFDTNVGMVDAPTVRITTPSDGDEVGGNMVAISATGTVASTATIVSIEIFVDGTSVGEGDSVPFNATWDASGLAIGSPHAITAVLTDSEGNEVTSEEVIVTIMANEDGCCSAGGDPTSPLTLAGMVLLGVLVRRRRRAA
ncbi:MAG TPA: Ig-like domain-containing protein [Kofleriaceae bacterium]|nr:Ig-like domain-containing protein [Kofleriaceae bacterium]